MFYVKNVPTRERVVRVIAGFAMVSCGLKWLGTAPLAYLFAGAGVITVLTGFFGFCPMCAMAGRRLKSE